MVVVEAKIKKRICGSEVYQRENGTKKLSSNLWQKREAKTISLANWVFPQISNHFH